jgi:hypothetical protein
MYISFDFSGIEWKQCLEGLQIVPVDDEIVMEADLVSKTFVLFWNQLMVFDEQMMVLNERFAFKLNLRHSMYPLLKSILYLQEFRINPKLKLIIISDIKSIIPIFCSQYNY